MILPAIGISGSNEGAITAAVAWIESMLLGPAATSIAILAVAILGIGMLWGRFDLRAAGRVALGAFILFGAPLIAYQMLGTLRGSEVAAPGVGQYRPPIAAAPQMPRNAPAQDPYAGAAVPQLQQ
jgi:type IV secretion system protein VirB2